MKKYLLTMIALFMLSATGFAEIIESGTTGDCTWTLSDDGTLTISGTGAMPDYTSLSLAPWYAYFSSITTVVIGDGVTSIGNEAFYMCSNMTSVTIGNSVTSIGKYAFNGCEKLTSVTIPNSVTSIGDFAFNSCDGLTSVTIPNSVTSIKAAAFSYCSSLSSVTIGSSVTSIGGGAFRDCSKLTSVTNLNPTPQSINNMVFQNVDLINATLYFPAESIEDYKAAEIWKEFGNIVPLFHVSITANNPSMGTVTGTGDYTENSTVTITATANPGYKFVKWDDDNTQNPRTITVTQDITCTAIFEAITYHVTVSANNTSMGTVTGTGDYEENSTATISATANPGYKFVKWDDDDTQNPRTITVTQDTTYTAIFDVNTNIQQTSDNDVSIYPNPVTESFRINGITAPTEVTVTDLSGRTVLQQIVEAGESVAAGNFPNGVYLVRAGGKTLKVVKN